MEGSRLQCGAIELTERDTGVLLADLIAVVVGEEHVRGQTTLGGVGVWTGTSERGS